MQQDFHYYTIGVLARGAGFNPADALVIATASQYVDDATEGERIPIQVNGVTLLFDPVLTSYKKLDMFKATDWSAQKRVWLPFHFLPSQPFDPDTHLSYSFITRPGSDFARFLVAQAAAEPLQRYKRRLCRLGVALHTLADSWAHQDFSGRKSDGENNVEAIYIKDSANQPWLHLPVENVVLDILPKLGHAQAAYFPDLAYQHWKFSLVPSPGEITRDNPAIFLEAAHTIYTILSEVEKVDPAPPIPWGELEPKLRATLSASGAKARLVEELTHSIDRALQAEAVEKRCALWRGTFQHTFGDLADQYRYDPTAWRQAALTGDVEWDKYTRKDWEQLAPRPVKSGFWDSYWVHFHRAALRQRHLVLERLP
jgi:hypothetical protein